MKKTKLRIHTWPEKILRCRCREVKEVNEEIRSLLDEMHSLMLIKGGVGLAANQAGIGLRLIVIETEDRLFKLVNPRIVKRTGKIYFKEGCLSFPGLELNIKRSHKAWVIALDEKGEKLELETEGILAVVFQHEIDHINGTGFIERASLREKIKAYPQLRKIIRRTKRELRKQRKKS
ncbi:MAG: peptide deformylase [Candidatus Omnitrophica bacterium]|nr:peptide deformylase [Candidatus Omnitrophota bacterium]MBD3268653.1 peptide deformylase [Candidatus Omnitrophota bacterium]